MSAPGQHPHPAGRVPHHRPGAELFAVAEARVADFDTGLDPSGGPAVVSIGQVYSNAARGVRSMFTFRGKGAARAVHLRPSPPCPVSRADRQVISTSFAVTVKAGLTIAKRSDKGSAPGLGTARICRPWSSLWMAPATTARAMAATRRVRNFRDGEDVIRAELAGRDARSMRPKRPRGKGPETSRRSSPQGPEAARETACPRHLSLSC